MKGSGRTGRPPGGGDSRAKILDAALREFAEKGYDKASVRGIARRVGCNAALIHHFFGTKEKLFERAVELPFDVSAVYGEALSSGPGHAGGAMVRAYFGAWDAPANRPKIMALLKSAMSDQKRASRVADFISKQAFAPVIGLITAPDPEYRINLIAGHLVGILLLRHALMVEPLASASVEDLAASIGPVIDHYLTGDAIGMGK